MAEHEHVLGGLRCFEVVDLAGSFVLGALDPDDEAAVRAHLAACPEAHAEVEELGGATAALFEAVHVVDAPAGLKERILTAAAAEGRAAADPVRAAGADPVPAGEGMPASEDDRSIKGWATREPAAEPARRGWDLGALFRRPIWAGVAAAALLVAVALGVLNAQLQTRLDGLSAYRDGVVEVLEEAARPGAKLAVLVAPEGGAGPSGIAAVGADGSIAMVMRDLAPTTGTQVYTAWIIGSDGKPIPVGDFRVDDSRTASFTTARASLGPDVTVALSIEPQPNPTTPTTVVALGTARPQQT